MLNSLVYLFDIIFKIYLDYAMCVLKNIIISKERKHKVNINNSYKIFYNIVFGEKLIILIRFFYNKLNINILYSQDIYIYILIPNQTKHRNSYISKHLNC